MRTRLGVAGRTTNTAFRPHPSPPSPVGLRFKIIRLSLEFAMAYLSHDDSLAFARQKVTFHEQMLNRLKYRCLANEGFKTSESGYFESKNAVNTSASPPVCTSKKQKTVYTFKFKALRYKKIHLYLGA